VIHQIFADSIVPSGQKRDLQLRPDSISRTHQHRPAKTRELEAGTEQSDIGQHAARKRPPRHPLDGRYRTIGFVDIDTRIAVSNLFLKWQISV
jgi:hypothetical protein